MVQTRGAAPDRGGQLANAAIAPRELREEAPAQGVRREREQERLLFHPLGASLPHTIQNTSIAIHGSSVRTPLTLRRTLDPSCRASILSGTGRPTSAGAGAQRRQRPRAASTTRRDPADRAHDADRWRSARRTGRGRDRDVPQRRAQRASTWPSTTCASRRRPGRSSSASLLAAQQRGVRVRLLYNVDHPGPIPVPPPPETRPEAIEALPVETRGDRRGSRT